MDDVDRILNSAPRRPSVRLVRDGEPIAPARYARIGSVGGARIEGLVDTGKVYDLFGDRATVVLQSLQRTWPPLARFCRDLELELTHAAQANAYLTPGGAAGLAAHHDAHDVFVLQVAGCKHWVVHEPLVDAPLPHQRADRRRAASQPVLFEAELHPGDVLYLPRGFIHAARAQEAVSLHVTIGLVATTVADVVEALVRQAVDADPRLRRSLPPGFADDPDGLRELVAATATSVGAAMGGAEPDRVAVGITERFWTDRRPLLDGQLQQLVGLGDIDDASTVRRRPRAVWRLQDVGDEVHLHLGDRTVAVPCGLRPALERLSGGAPVAVSDLADLLDGQSRLVLVRRLVREGALVAGGGGAGAGG